MARANIGDVLREAGGALGAFGTQRRLSRQEEEQRMKEEKAARLTEFLLQQQGITDAPVQGALGAGGITPQGIASLLPQKEGPDKPPKFKQIETIKDGKPSMVNVDVGIGGEIVLPEGHVFRVKKEKPPRPRDEEVFTKEEAMGHASKLVKGKLPGFEWTPVEKALFGLDLEVIYGKKFSTEEIDAFIKGTSEESVGDDDDDKTTRAGFWERLGDKILGDGANANQVTETGIKTINNKEEYDALPSGTEFLDKRDGKKYRKP